MLPNKVLIAQKTHPDVLAILTPHAETVSIREGDADDLLAKIVDCRAVLLGTWLRFTAEYMDAAKELKVISRTGVGVDSVDVEAASKRGIYVLNTPGANAVTVAEHALAMIISLAKYIVFLDGQVRNDSFKSRRLYLPVDLDGKTLGVIGFGAIGRLLAEKCRLAFNMEVLAYDPFVSEWPDWVQPARLMDDIFIHSDFVSLHMPLTEETKNIIGERTLSLMKSSAFLINTSRGEIVDEDALYEFLKENKIAGAGLDVLKKEPPDPDDKLLSLPNVILTPHTGALTRECSLRVAKCAAQGIADYFQGKTPAHIVNRDFINL